MKNIKSLLAAGTLVAGLGVSAFSTAPEVQAIDWSGIVSTDVTNGTDITFNDIDGAKQNLLDSTVDYLTNTSTTQVTFNTWTLNVNGTDYSSLAEAMGVEGNVNISMFGDDLEGDPTTHFGDDADAIMSSLASAVSGSKVADIFGIDISTKVNSMQVGFMTKTLQPVAFTAKVPTNLPAVAEGATRTYHLVSQHGDETKEVASTYNSATNEISGSVDEFSLFAVVYKDTLPNSNENTPTENNTTTPSSDKQKAMEEMGKEMEKLIAKGTSTGSTKKSTAKATKVKAPNTGATDGAKAASGLTVLTMATLAGGALLLKKRG